MSRPDKPLVWDIEISRDQPYQGAPTTLTMLVYNNGALPIKPEIHHLPGQNSDLFPDKSIVLQGELLLNTYMDWSNQVCPDPDGVRAKLIRDHIRKGQKLSIRFTYESGKYIMELGVRRWSGSPIPGSSSAQRGEDTVSVQMESEAYENSGVEQLVDLREDLESEKAKSELMTRGLLESKQGEGEVQQLQTIYQQRVENWEKERSEPNKQIDVLIKEVERLQTKVNQLKVINQKLEKENREEVKKTQEELQQAEKVPPEYEKISLALKEAEEKRKEMIRNLETAQEEIDERLKLHQGIKGAYQELLRSFSIEDDISEESSGIEKAAVGLADFRTRMEGMHGVEYFFVFRELRDEFERWVKESKAEVPWDSVLMAFLRGLREEVEKNIRQPLTEEQVGKLRGFVERRGFKLIWSDVGNDLVMREHQILREEVVKGIGRGQVIRTLTPGLLRGEEVIVKAGIVLAQ